MARTKDHGMAADDPSAISRLAAFIGGGVIDARSIERAADIFARIQHPDPGMVAAGDGDVWRRMVDAALAQRWDVPEALALGVDRHLSGSDEEGDMTLAAPSNLSTGSWVQLGDGEQ
jgi:hypothetical protein